MNSFLRLFLLVFLIFIAPAEVSSAEATQTPPRVECRKLGKDVECPLDYWMISTAIPSFDFLGKLGVTANHLTLTAAVLQILACIFLWRRSTFLAGFFWIFGYYFDAIDGSYARYHHLCSPYGDMLDHYRDWACAALLFVVLYFRYPLKRFDYLFLGLLILLVSIGFAAQDQYIRHYNNQVPPSEVLSMLGQSINHFNLNTKEALYWLRWIGSANINLVLAVYLAILPFTRSRRTTQEESVTQ